MKYIQPVLTAGAKGDEVPYIASAEFLELNALTVSHERGKLTLLDVHDDIVLQQKASGIMLTPEEESSLARSLSDNIGAFRFYSVPGEALARIIGLDPARTFVAWNGTDTQLLQPGPWPNDQAIAMVTGAAPGRGLEFLIEAARELRKTHTELRLLLFVVATSPGSQRYLDGIKALCRGEGWIAFTSCPYPELGRRLGEATVLCAPHPPSRYWDAAAPVKVSDYLAVGRPVVTTPRVETIRLLDACGGGVVAEDDSVGAFVAAVDKLLYDEALARALGEQARASAEKLLDWSHIGDALADWLLARVA